MNQEVPADEVVVVDNNCKDRSMEIASQFKVRIVKEPKQGMIYARNRGFDEAKGDVIIRIDGDTLLPSDWVKRVKQAFEGASFDGLSGPIYYNDLPLQTTLFSKLYLRYLQKEVGHPCFIGSNMCITKKLWNKVKSEVCLNDKLVHEDIDLSYHVGKAGGVIHYDPQMILATSGRRIKKNPLSFFIEYPKRLKTTFAQHSI